MPRVRNSESISSKKTMTGHPLLALLPGPLEDQADLALGLADVLVEQLGALDVEEVAAGRLVAGHLGHLLGQGVGDRLGDEGLAAAGGAVQQDALRRRQLVLDEQLPVQERQLDGVGDGLDLVVEAADVGVGDVGHLLEDQLLHLRPGQLLEQQPGPGVHQRRSRRPGASRPSATSASSTTRSSSARPTMMARMPSSSTSLRVTTSPDCSVAAGQDHVERLVEDDLLAPLELGSLGSARGAAATRILRPPEKTSTVPSSLRARKVP